MPSTESQPSATQLSDTRDHILPTIDLDSEEIPHLTQPYVVPVSKRTVVTVEILELTGPDTDGVMIYLDIGDDQQRWTRLAEWGPLSVDVHPIETPAMCARYFRLIAAVSLVGAGTSGTAVIILDPGAESAIDAEAREREVSVPDLHPASPPRIPSWPGLFFGLGGEDISTLD